MKKLVFALAVAAAALLSGCIASAPVVPVESLAPADTRVTIAPDLHGVVQVTDVRCAPGKSSFLTLQANMVNICNVPLAVEWKVQWLDADGVEIDSVVSSWNARMLHPQEICGLKNTAPKSDAADMRFYVRRARQ